MSKVIHLSLEAHTQARQHCERHGLKMSHWVAELIDRACRGEVAGGDVRPAWSTRRRLPAAEQAEGAQGGDGPEPEFTAPPFWADGTAS